MRAAPLLLLFACARPGPSDGADAPETDTPPLPTGDTAPDTAPRPVCADDTPDGVCPAGTTCQAGRCLFDVDPGTPPGDLGDRWAAFVAWAAPRDLSPDDHPVAWRTLEADVAQALTEAPTDTAAAWAIASGLSRARNGHTYALPAALCDVDWGLGDRESDAGACLTEGEGGALVVHAVRAGTPWRPGDVLLSLDDRPAEALVADRMAQPRCARRPTPPRDDGRRAEAIASLLRRNNSGGTARVRGVDGAERTFELPYEPVRLVCDGRVPPIDAVDVGGGVHRTDLAGGVVLLSVDRLGADDGGGLAAAPMIAALRAQLTALEPATPVVIDLRSVFGGFSEVADQLASWLLPGGSTLRRCRDRIGPAPEDVTDLVTLRTTADPTLAYAGPVAILTDALTYGSAELVAIALGERALRVGAPGYGSPGLSWRHDDAILGGSIDGRRCEDAEGGSLEGVALPMDVPAALRPQDAAAGIDTVVEAARTALLAR